MILSLISGSSYKSSQSISSRNISSSKVIKYDNVNLITPDKREELIEDLQKRTGLKIEKIEVGSIDFLKDAAIIKMYYRSKEANNSVDTTLKAPVDEYKLKD